VCYSNFTRLMRDFESAPMWYGGDATDTVEIAQERSKILAAALNS
jgi:hypothetical protein